MKLVKYVIVDDSGMWYSMFDSEHEARLVARRNFENHVYVEQWTYPDAPDGTSGDPNKLRLPDPERTSTDEGMEEMPRGITGNIDQNANSCG